MKKILIADDNTELRENIAEFMAEAGYYTEFASNGKEAAAKAADTDFDVVLLDMLMPVMRGAEALTEIKKTRPAAKVIVMTAFSSIENAVEIIKKGAAVFAALKKAKEMKDGVLVVVLPDRGDRYLSTSLFKSVCADCPP